MISVVNKKLITSDESFLTRAPITPREVSRKYSKGRDFEVVLRKGYKKRGMCASTKIRNKTSQEAGEHTVQKKVTSFVV